MLANYILWPVVVSDRGVVLPVWKKYCLPLWLVQKKHDLFPGGTLLHPRSKKCRSATILSDFAIVSKWFNVSSQGASPQTVYVYYISLCVLVILSHLGENWIWVDQESHKETYSPTTDMDWSVAAPTRFFSPHTVTARDLWSNPFAPRALLSALESPSLMPISGIWNGICIRKNQDWPWLIMLIFWKYLYLYLYKYIYMCKYIHK